MRRDTVLASVLTLACVAMLSACGADDNASASASNAVTANDTTQDAAIASPQTGTSNVPSDADAFARANAPGIAQDMQATLAADSQQVAPVIHYAPGDSAANTSN
ncbi:hypothetical protein [Paraburkholderia sp.]|uniref:hypothetical protein n=1 Tax=Paraburkholderia sp. TaxID=1926495 RepID=UPI0023977020|nr:hypothetical protein [Paraburkholderia sp.]MDE1180572.1 hypothetical protein [Paraburkholderia sp.]